MAQGKSTATPRSELAYLRACLKWAAKHGYINRAPHIFLPPEAEARTAYLTKDQFRAVLSSVETPHVRLFLILAVTTGARMSAILDLRWHQIDLERGRVNFLPAGRRRTNKRRPVVPLNAIAIEALQAAFPAALTDYVIEYAGRPVGNVKKALEAASARSGIKCTAHMLRHTAGVWMAESGARMEEIAQMLGHSNMEITRKHYAQYSPDYLRRVSESLTF